MDMPSKNRTRILVAVGAVIGLAAAGAALYRTGAVRLNPFATNATATPLTVDAPGKAGFTRLGPETTGIDFVNQLTPDHAEANRIYDIGSGVAAGDFDNDGWCDLYFARLDGPNALYRNLGGWRFEEVAAEAGVACPEQMSTSATFTDIDGDRDLDLLVGAIPGLRCFVNNGNGTFSDSTQGSGLANRWGTTTLALGDADGDGDLDLFVTSYRADTIRDWPSINLRMVNGRLEIPPELNDRVVVQGGKLEELGEPDALYLNDGDGRFAPVSWTDGTFLDEDGEPLASAPLDWGLSTTFRDINGDGLADIYQCNDFVSPDRIWVNQGGGRFRAIDRLALRSTSALSMGIDFGDVNRDGLVDFFVTDMLSPEHERRNMQIPGFKHRHANVGDVESRTQITRNTLFIQREDRTFTEVANYAGVEASEWSWATMFVDADLDGYEDIFVANGYARDVQHGDIAEQIESMDQSGATLQGTYRLFPRLEVPDTFFRNLGGLKFHGVGAEWGFRVPTISHGAALADLDGDGDLDLAVNSFETPAGIYRNDASAARVAVRLLGPDWNAQGIGAVVRLEGSPVPQSREIASGGVYLSGSEPIVSFAAGEATTGMRIVVDWPSGYRSVVEDVKPNHLYTVHEAGASGSRPSPEAPPEPLFEDVTASLRHAHQEDVFDDFQRQPLLPRRLSQLGPGVAWSDLDGDGDDDLIAGAGKGGAVSFLLNDGRGAFTPASAAGPIAPLSRDAAGTVAWTEAAGVASTLVGLSNYQDGQPDGLSVARFDVRGSAFTTAEGVSGRASSTGPLAMADVDGDGDLDLFAGGRVVPGRYPEAPESMLLRNDGGAFVVDEAATGALRGAGMISGAVFTDVDGNGWPDLALACDWGPVRVFLNESGTLRDATGELGLADFTGWWNGVTAGDLDGDGRMDLVATNWGENGPYHPTAERPALLYSGDFDGNGTVDTVEAYLEPGSGRALPVRNYLAARQGFPTLRERVPTFVAYAKSDLTALLGPSTLSAPRLSASTLSNTVFMNRGGRFEPVAMPLDAQLAPAFGVTVADFDGDGNEDVFLAQNFFPVRVDMPRLDSGRGLLLRGDGKGGLTPMRGSESGIRVYGDARGAAVGDFDRDGRADLVVAQNGAATRLFKNARGRQGLRVRLAGADANASGVGATVRLVWGDRQGPAREVRAGSGYWSQDSSVLVLGAPEPPGSVRVRWPGGEVTVAPVPAGAREVVVSRDGSVRAVQ